MTDSAKKERIQKELRPFRIEIPQADLDDLQDRLVRTRWVNELPAKSFAAEVQTGPIPPGWEYGVPLQYVKERVEYWRDGYDWREWEDKLNGYPQFTTTIDGQNIHFVHVRSPEPDAGALILTHGWPNSFLEYLELVAPLTDPRTHGADPADAFHVVIPSIPGFGFSGPTEEPGWNRYRTARAWVELMRALGYDSYGTHGNDAGAYIAPEMGRIAPDEVVGVHVNQIFSFPSGDPAELEGLTEEELRYLEFLQNFDEEMSAFAKLQATKPQNAAHALADSPAGQLAWIGQLLGESVSRETVVTNAAIYWFTNTAASSARFYYEDAHAEHPKEPTTVPIGLASFAFDFKPLRRLAERDHKNIVSWNDFDRGGHWAAHDAPDLLVEDIRQFIRHLN
jgi:pimeloyl-ACP methyl ester carboxylesterase